MSLAVHSISFVFCTFCVSTYVSHFDISSIFNLNKHTNIVRLLTKVQPTSASTSENCLADLRFYAANAFSIFEVEPVVHIWKIATILANFFICGWLRKSILYISRCLKLLIVIAMAEDCRDISPDNCRDSTKADQLDQSNGKCLRCTSDDGWLEELLWLYC